MGISRLERLYSCPNCIRHPLRVVPNDGSTLAHNGVDGDVETGCRAEHGANTLHGGTNYDFTEPQAFDWLPYF